MKRQIAKSSNLKSVGYDETTALLEVEFLHGGVYCYHQVPLEIFIGLINSESLGRFLNIYMRGGHNLFY